MIGLKFRIPFNDTENELSSLDVLVLGTMKRTFYKCNHFYCSKNCSLPEHQAMYLNEFLICEVISDNEYKGEIFQVNPKDLIKKII
jgi:hypothetical protein